jgi:hypothetical protein
MSGQWQDAMACMGTSHCTNGVCMECMQGQFRCNTAHTALETCDANGQWQTTACPTNVCVDPGQCEVPDAAARR